MNPNENLLGDLIRIGIRNGEFPKSLYKYYAINEDTVSTINYLNNNVETIKQMVLTKSKDWEYEQEIRALRDNGTENKVHIPKDAIRSIIFGPKMQTDTDLYRKLMEAIPKTTRLFKCEVDNSTYKLNIVPYSK